MNLMNSVTSTIELVREIPQFKNELNPFKDVTQIIVGKKTKFSFDQNYAIAQDNQ